MPPRKRAAQACQACHAHRVKCDFFAGAPCSRCRQKGLVCEERDSRRGKYPRTATRPDQTQAPSERQAAFNEGASEEPSCSSAAPDTLCSPVEAVEDDSEIFLGESNSLRFMQTRPNALSDRHERRPGRHHIAVHPGERWTTAPPGCEALLSFPDLAVQDALLTAYFRWFHCSFPIVDEPDIWQKHQNNSLPTLLLYLLLFIGAAHCEDAVLQQLGQQSRQEVKFEFFTHAKSLYDHDYESSKLVVGQSLFLMSFWRGDPLAEKDSRHWIGSAIALLQKMGFHRARQAKGVRKRLWWAVYIRERQIAAALGLPNRIRDEDCDVEGLSNDDSAGAFRASLGTDAVEVIVNFNVGMVGIAALLGDVLHARYLPGKRNDEVHHQELREKLSQWRAKYLGTMPISVADGAACRNFYVNTLLMAYHNLRILLFRSDEPGIQDEENEDLGGSEVLDASTAICRIVEDMLSSGTIHHCQIHVITNIFNTLCVQTLGLRTWTGERRTLAVYRAKICLLGLRELQKTWDVTNWVLRLYFKYLDQGTAARLAMEGAEEDLHPSGGEAGEQSHREQPTQYSEANWSIRGAAQELGGHQDIQAVPRVPFPMPVEPDASLLAELGDGFVFDGNVNLGDHTWSLDLLTQLI